MGRHLPVPLRFIVILDAFTYCRAMVGSPVTFSCALVGHKHHRGWPHMSLPRPCLSRTTATLEAPFPFPRLGERQARLLGPQGSANAPGSSTRLRPSDRSVKG